MVAVAMWAFFLAAMGLLWARELLALGDARRNPTGDISRDLARFRRRTLGLALLLVLAAFVHLGAATPDLDHQGRIGWAGICFIVVIWLLIIATRDFRASLEDIMDEQQRAAIEAIIEIERLTPRPKPGEPLPDHMMIPRLDFGPSDTHRP